MKDFDFKEAVETEVPVSFFDRKLNSRETRRQRILGNLRATDGWEFVSYISFINGKGICQVSSMRMRKGYEIYNPNLGPHGLTLIVSRAMVDQFTNIDIKSLPRRTKRVTKIIDLGDVRRMDVWPDISVPLTAEQLLSLTFAESGGFNFSDEFLAVYVPKEVSDE